MSQFELLDEILNEESHRNYDEYFLYEKGSKFDSIIFSELDEKIEESMRASLRETIYNSVDDSSEKIRKLQIIERVEFSDEQISSYMDNYIKPIIEIGGYDKIDWSDERKIKSVSIPVYEVYTELTKEAEFETSSLIESVLGSEPSLNSIKNILESYDINDFELKKNILKEADMLSNSDLLVIPDVENVAGLVFAYNELQEMVGYKMPSLNQLLEAEAEAKEGFIKRIKDKIAALYERIKTPEGSNEKEKIMEKIRRLKGEMKDAAGARYAAAKDSVKQFGTKHEFLDVGPDKKTTLTKKGKIIAGLASAAAIAGVAALAWKKFKDNKCSGLSGDALKKCKKAAALQAAKAAGAKMSSCSAARNPEKCKSKVKAEVNKWKQKAASYK